jgi:hypothetical protein
MALNGLGLARLEVGDRSGAAAAFQECCASIHVSRTSPLLAGLGSRQLRLTARGRRRSPKGSRISAACPATRSVATTITS